MKITHDSKIDALYIRLNERARYHSSRKLSDDVMVDYTADGKIVGLEVLNASQNVKLPAGAIEILRTAAPKPSA